VPTLESLARDLADRQASARRREQAIKDQVRNIADRARGEGRSHLTGPEDARVSALIAERDRLRGELADLDRQCAEVDEAREQERQEAIMYNQSRPVYPSARQVPGAVLDSREGGRFRIGSEPRTYDERSDPKGSRFLLDVARGFQGRDPSANERLARHQREFEVDNPRLAMRAASTSGSFAGLIVPQFLTEMYAPLARQMRPLADCMNHHDLPNEGMTVNVPLLSTGTSVGIQSPENNAGSSTAINDTLLTENVLTATGNITISRQAIDRGTGVDEVAMQDLFNALASVVDSTVINTATVGLLALATNISLTSAATLANYWPLIFQGASSIERALLQVGKATHVVMSIPRWQWLTSQLTSSWPIAGMAASGPDPRQLGIEISDQYGDAVRSRLGNGMLVCVDANLPLNQGASSNQDVTAIIAAQEGHLWEDPAAPVYIRAEQPAAASLGVLLVIWEYFAFSWRRYTGAHAQITGSGMVVPSGF
jgi:hypothetical protein